MVKLLFLYLKLIHNKHTNYVFNCYLVKKTYSMRLEKNTLRKGLVK